MKKTLKTICKKLIKMILTSIPYVFWMILPIFGCFIGYLNGAILIFFTKDTVIKGLNMLFNNTCFTKESIPYILAAINAFLFYLYGTHTLCTTKTAIMKDDDDRT